MDNICAQDNSERERERGKEKDIKTGQQLC